MLKIRQSAKIKELLAGSFTADAWEPAGQGWEGTWSHVRLADWTTERRVILLRRPIREDLVVAKRKGLKQAQMELEMGCVREGRLLYEYAVLVTNMKDEILSLAQHYRDRGDAENNFDDLKNQWGWLGFTTQDHARSEMMTLFVALVYNWWSLFCLLSIPNKHAEAITARPLLLHAVGWKTSHGNQSTLTVTGLHAQATTIESAMKAVAAFLVQVRANAEQLIPMQRWRLILQSVVRAFPLRSSLDVPLFEFKMA